MDRLHKLAIGERLKFDHKWFQIQEQDEHKADQQPLNLTAEEKVTTAQREAHAGISGRNKALRVVTDRCSPFS